MFSSGPNDVYLHPLRAGVQVIAGTVLGHVGSEAAGATGLATSPSPPAPDAPGTTPAAGAQSGGPHMFFQIKPAGVGAPLIDPKPILDGWVALENTSIFRAKGENPFLATSPSVGQVLLESKGQLEQLLGRDASIHMRACERQDVQTGRVDRRVLATLEFLSVSGPEADGLRLALHRRLRPRRKATRRRAPVATRSRSRRSTASRSPAIRARARSRIRRSASC